MQTEQQLQIVAALVAHRHFGRAAQALGLSQPALTKAVRAMERQLGAALFDRGPPVAPTPFGMLIAARGAAILDAFGALRREIDLARGLDTGRLVVAAGGQVAEFSVIDAVAAFSRAHPFIACDLQIGDHHAVTRDVAEGRADLGVALLTEAVRNESLIAEPLRRASYVVFCAADHPLVGRSDIPLEELLAYPWIGTSAVMPAIGEPPPGRHAFGEVERKTGRVELRLRATTFSALLRIVMRSHAISAAPAPLIAPHVASGRLQALRAPFGWEDLEYGIILKKNRTPSPAAETFMAMLRRIESALDRTA